jgi:hypothetical protein
MGVVTALPKTKELIMKKLFFRSSLICLSALVAGLLNVCFSGNFASSKSTEARSAKKMKFNFAKYDVKRPDVAQAKLEQLFPEGSSLADFRSGMEQSGAKCYSDTSNQENVVYCQRRIDSSLFVKSDWTVLVNVVDQDKISKLKVTAGLTGP